MTPFFFCHINAALNGRAVLIRSPCSCCFRKVAFKGDVIFFKSLPLKWGRVSFFRFLFSVCFETLCYDDVK